MFLSLLYLFFTFIDDKETNSKNFIEFFKCLTERCKNLHYVNFLKVSSNSLYWISLPLITIFYILLILL